MWEDTKINYSDLSSIRCMHIFKPSSTITMCSQICNNCDWNDTDLKRQTLHSPSHTKMFALKV